MSGSGDRARYFLEQCVPELQELLQKEVFSKQEISAVSKKRSDFEHVLNARGSRPQDFVRYIAYEQNLERLRAKRMHRLGVRRLAHSGPRRTFYLFERATRKFPHDFPLWLQYLEYAKLQRAYKRMGKVLTAVLRLHPSNPQLWIRAAQYANQRQDSPAAARGYYQRGIRFCPEESRLWVEYCKMEMMFIAHITENLANMGIKNQVCETQFDGGAWTNYAGAVEMETEADQLGGTQGNQVETLELPEPPANDSLDIQALQHMAATPALTGNIPKAIYDAAMIQFHHSSCVAEMFFDAISSFSHLHCATSLLRHIVEDMKENGGENSERLLCQFKLYFHGIDPISPQLLVALAQAVSCLSGELLGCDGAMQTVVVKKVKDFFSRIASLDGLETGTKELLKISLEQLRGA